ncbi:MAG: hypothetical protein KKB34_19600 [Bacteroidetes bacterium]|nr:hypothetical protein [Bacteroidota bacterium]
MKKKTISLKLIQTILFILITLSVKISAIDFNIKESDNILNNKTEYNTLAMYSQLGKNVALKGNVSQMSYFFESLKSTKSKQVRIAHFGDSIIWGDMITSQIRETLQSKYGGQGIGFLSAANDDVMVRSTLLHRFSDDWDWVSVFTKNSQHYPLSINGITSVPSANSWVSYEATNTHSSGKNFKEITIIYGNTNNNSKVNITAGSENASMSLSPGSDKVNIQKYKLNSEQSSVKLKFDNCAGSYIYGISLENGNGVYVDNFPMRGNSGISLKDIDDNVLRKISTDMDYKLLILNFGINVVEAGKTDFTGYEKRMIRVINDLKKSFPETSIIIVGAGDKAVKKGSKLVSDKIVPRVVAVQEKIANQTGVAFWNMYEAMGSEGSMNNWVDEGLAARDYIHFSVEGGKIIADYLLNAIMKENKN